MTVPWVVQQKEIKKQNVESKKIYFFPETSFLQKPFLQIASIS